MLELLQCRSVQRLRILYPLVVSVEYKLSCFLILGASGEEREQGRGPAWVVSPLFSSAYHIDNVCKR